MAAVTSANSATACATATEFSNFRVGKSTKGHWLDDKKSGQGIVIWPDGEKYVGGFRDGKMDGKGVYTYSNGRKREGVWAKGKLQRGTAPSTPR